MSKHPTLADRVLDVLGLVEDEVTSREIWERLNCLGAESSIGGALSTLERNGHVVCTRRGNGDYGVPSLWRASA